MEGWINQAHIVLGPITFYPRLGKFAMAVAGKGERAVSNAAAYLSSKVMEDCYGQKVSVSGTVGDEPGQRGRHMTFTLGLDRNESERAGEAKPRP